MHVIVKERDTESPAIGTQVEASNAHRVLINTTQRTMEITELPSGELLTRCSDLLGHPVQVRNELGHEFMTGKEFLLAQTQEERTGAKEDLPGAWADLPAEERMLRVGIQGIVSSFMYQRAQAHDGKRGTVHDSELVNSLFQYVRHFRPNALEVTEDMVEYAARAAFQRNDAYRGANWARGGVGINPTTEATREEFRRNARTALDAAQEFTRHEADAPEPKDPHFIGGIIKHPQADDMVLADDRPALKFGAFWDVMQGLLIDGQQHLVVFRAGGNVYAAIAARGDDGATPIWLVSLSGSVEDGSWANKHNHRPLYHLSNLSGFTILGTYQHVQDCPF